MGGVFKGFVVALAVLAVAADHAGAITIPPTLVLPPANSEARALFQWPRLAKRDGDHLLVMNHGGGPFSTVAAVFTDGTGDCQTYRFTGVRMLFDGYTRRREPVAELTCQTADGALHALVRDNGNLVNGAGQLTASADGHYLFIERSPLARTDETKAPRIVTEIVKWTVGGSGNGGPFTVDCSQSRPDGPSDFRARCTDPKTGRGFDARFAAADPGKPDKGFKTWRLYNLSDPSDSKPYYLSDSIVITNMADPFVTTANEARAIADHPGLVRRDGAELVLLDSLSREGGGHDGRRLRDDHCTYWYFGDKAELYDPRTGTKAPVAEVDCQRGEFSLRVLAPPYAVPLFAYQHYAVSDDGKTVLIGYGSTDVVDWQSRRVLLSYPHRCHDMTVHGEGHFTGNCDADNRSDAERVVDFERDASGTWTASEQPRK